MKIFTTFSLHNIMPKYMFYGNGRPEGGKVNAFRKYITAASDDDACLEIFFQLNIGLVSGVFVTLPFLDVNTFPDTPLCKKYWWRYNRPTPWILEPIWDDDCYDEEDKEAIEKLKIEYIRKILRGEVSGKIYNRFSCIHLEELNPDGSNRPVS